MTELAAPGLTTSADERATAARGHGSSWLVPAVLVVLSVAACGGEAHSGVAQGRDVIATVPTVTVPELPSPVDTSGFRDGWYLVLVPRIFTIDDDLLLQAARELTIEARNAGYGEAILIRQVPGRHRCAGGVCSSSGAPDGYLVILKGRYDVPEWGDSEADRHAEDEWYRSTRAAEVAEATARGLTLQPRIVYLEFSST